jgi:hypothetical protein
MHLHPSISQDMIVRFVSDRKTATFVLISIATKDNVNEGKKLVEAIKFHHDDKELPVLLGGQAFRDMEHGRRREKEHIESSLHCTVVTQEDDGCLDEIVINLVEKLVVIR